MYKTLLVATDGTKLSEKALAHAIALAQAVGATLTAFYAAPDYPMPAYADGVVYEPVSRKEYAKLAAEDAQKILDAAATKAEAAGVTCKTAYAIASAPWEAITIASHLCFFAAARIASHGAEAIAYAVLHVTPAASALVAGGASRRCCSAAKRRRC